MTGWGHRDIPDLTGKRAVVTGANSGVGYATAVALARAGAAVVMTARNPGRGAEALQRLRASVPGAQVEVGELDLADRESVRTFSRFVGAAPVDILVNNAGVMALPRSLTNDGLEMQFATNHLGHFALTGLLLPALTRRGGARIVTVSSIAHWWGALDFHNLMGEHRYQPWTAYGQSKLANLLFMRELHRRAAEAGLSLVSAAAHPGITATDLYGPHRKASANHWPGKVLWPLTRIVGQSAEAGALPQLYAATAPDVRGGDYFGPRGPAELRGRPKRVRMSKNARDDKSAQQLWDVSEELTDVRFAFTGRAG